MAAHDVCHYLDRRGRDLVTDWLVSLLDVQAKAQIVKRLNRLEYGNFGDHKVCRDGVWELRVDAGPGYRVYYALVRTSVVLLLCGGDKGSQAKDIDRAVKYLQEWRERP